MCGDVKHFLRAHKTMFGKNILFLKTNTRKLSLTLMILDTT